jgi:pyridinium-3,5-bisthiocarboxylic acid mononucleotide nickel chelatase
MVVIIDPQNAGIAGNMIVGAFLDLGTDVEGVQDVMEYYASYFGDINIKISKVKKSGIQATYADVRCKDKGSIRYGELLGRLDKIKHEKAPENVLEFSKKVFRTLAEAEAKVHGTGMKKVHFHEVGAADAVADIVGTAYCFHQLKLDSEKIYGMPVALGGGRIESQHGSLPVPAPATLEILKNVPVFGGPVNRELTTPTGAALLVNLVDEFCEFYPLLTSRKVGYGAGKQELPFPNVLRILVGDSQVSTDQVTILETNLDNVTGEVLGHSFKRLMDAGALDVTMVPTITKKNRPGHLLRVIVKSGDCDAVSEAIIRETGTLGVRVLPYVHRNIAERKIVPVEVDIAGTKRKIRIKVGVMGEEIISVRPEYEDARKMADETGVPLKDVMKWANDEFKRILDEK